MFAVSRKLVPSSLSKSGAWVMLALSVVFTLQAPAAERAILLRNQTIDTSAGKREGLRQGFRAAATASVSELYLIQVSENLPNDWREQLAALNVSIARPVPHDAFVIELKETNLAQLEALPFVQWIGPYLPEYKAHVNL